MVTIGGLWEQNELSLAEEHLAPAMTERLIGQLAPLFSPRTSGSTDRVIMGCLEGERQALELRMLADLFRQHCYQVLYLGADVPQHDWVPLVLGFHADLVAISASLARSEPQLRDLVRGLRTAKP